MINQWKVKYHKQWFTLIELVIAMTIFFIIMIMTYVNYAYFQNIAKVKLSLKEISQSINEARNLAISWFEKNWINQSIWVYFDISNKNIIQFYSFNYNSGILLDSNQLLKERKLQNNIGIDVISSQDKIMIYFSSISAKPEIYSFDSAGIKSVFSPWELNFSISFKWASNFPLKRELKYFKNTNVVDY